MEILEQFLYNHHIIFTPADFKKLDIYMRLFFEWNRIHHLSSLKNQGDFLSYCQDSLFPITFIPSITSLLDVGSGAGFPALVLAIFLKDTQVYLVEPNKKKAAFLEIATLEMGLSNVRVFKKRIQELGVLSVDMVTSRALCSLKDFLPLLTHITHQSILLYKGQRADDELLALKDASEFQIRRFGKMTYLYKERAC